jgi:acetolactate synthase I/II/III large subunit
VTGILRTPLPFTTTTPGLSLGLPSNPLHLFEPPTDSGLIKQAAALINQAQRPIIYAGNGVLSSPLGPKLLAEFAEKGNIPVATALQGLGAYGRQELAYARMHG